MVEPFAGGRPPRLAPNRSATVTVFGAPIPAAGVNDPTPSRRTPRNSLGVVRDTVSYGWRTRWTPSRRRRLVHLAAVIVLVFSVALVLAAAISILAG